MTNLALSSLSHTWIIDIDGTIVRHNGYKEGEDQLLEGVKEFWSKIPVDDMIVLISAREHRFLASTSEFLNSNGIRFDYIIFGIPKGERILINDLKPSGLETAYAVNVLRDKGLKGLSLTCLK
jgi:hypothetical protein